MAVFLPRRLVDVQAVQPFGIALNDRQRRLQFVRHGENKGLAHVFDFFGLVELLLQLFVRLLQRRQGFVQLIRQDIETRAQLADFISPLPLPFLGKIQMCHSRRQALELQ